jgi:hypothetical protein
MMALHDEVFPARASGRRRCVDLWLRLARDDAPNSRLCHEMRFPHCRQSTPGNSWRGSDGASVCSARSRPACERSARAAALLRVRSGEFRGTRTGFRGGSSWLGIVPRNFVATCHGIPGAGGPTVRRICDCEGARSRHPAVAVAAGGSGHRITICADNRLVSPDRCLRGAHTSCRWDQRRSR